MDFLRTLADCKQITVFAKSFFSIKRQEIFRRSPKSAHSDFFAWASAVFRSNSIIRATEFSHENRAAYLRSSAPTASVAVLHETFIQRRPLKRLFVLQNCFGNRPLLHSVLKGFTASIIPRQRTVCRTEFALREEIGRFLPTSAVLRSYCRTGVTRNENSNQEYQNSAIQSNTP